MKVEKIPGFSSSAMLVASNVNCANSRPREISMNFRERPTLDSNSHEGFAFGVEFRRWGWGDPGP